MALNSEFKSYWGTAIINHVAYFLIFQRLEISAWYNVGMIVAQVIGNYLCNSFWRSRRELDTRMKLAILDMDREHKERLRMERRGDEADYHGPAGD